MRHLASLLAFLLLFSVAGPLRAQEATPSVESGTSGPDFADTLGLPEVVITATENGFRDVPDRLTAGRYVVTLVRGTGLEVPALLGFVLLPEGKTAEDLLETYAPSMTVSPDGIDWIYTAYAPGGLGLIPPAERAQVILDLIPGTYGLTLMAAGTPPTPPLITVTGDAGSPVTTTEPSADATLIETGAPDAGFAYRLEGTLATGPQLLAIRNETALIQNVQIMRSPDAITREQLISLFNGESPDPSTGPVNPESWVFTAFAGSQSAGTTQWLSLDLMPGYYILLSTISDPNTGRAFAALGMVAVVPVGIDGAPDAGTPAA